MEPNKYILHCSNCKPSKWVEIKKEAFSLIIILDLKTDEWVFIANCPVCDKKIENRRKAFY